jgi:hypothetical protein
MLKAVYAAVIDAHDSLSSHVEDTLIAGAGLCHPDVVEYTVGRGKECIDWLIKQGVAFSKDHETTSAPAQKNNTTLPKRVGIVTGELSTPPMQPVKLFLKALPHECWNIPISALQPIAWPWIC